MWLIKKKMAWRSGGKDTHRDSLRGGRAPHTTTKKLLVPPDRRTAPEVAKFTRQSQERPMGTLNTAECASTAVHEVVPRPYKEAASVRTIG